VPLTTLRFQGADLAGRKFGFELAIDRLAKSRDGFVLVVNSGILQPLQAGDRLRIGDIELTVRYDDNSTNA
jgi:hypothetical protein